MSYLEKYEYRKTLNYIKSLRIKAKQLAKIHNAPVPKVTVTRKRWGPLGHYSGYQQKIQISSRAAESSHLSDIFAHEFAHHIRYSKRKSTIFEDVEEREADELAAKIKKYVS